MNKCASAAVILMLGVSSFDAAVAEQMCASEEQARIIRDYYAENPGAPPVAAARQLKLPEALIGSGLPAEQVAATGARQFEQVWAALTEWDTSIVIITKGADVLEVFGAISPGERSADNPRFNLTHDNPFAGHLRPDLYSSIYAYSLPGMKGAVTRGVFFYGQDGASVFGVMMSGKGPPAPPGEVKKFEELMALIRSLPPVCSAAG